jgi:hypothetical protein
MKKPKPSTKSLLRQSIFNLQKEARHAGNDVMMLAVAAAAEGTEKTLLAYDATSATAVRNVTAALNQADADVTKAADDFNASLKILDAALEKAGFDSTTVSPIDVEGFFTEEIMTVDDLTEESDDIANDLAEALDDFEQEYDPEDGEEEDEEEAEGAEK